MLDGLKRTLSDRILNPIARPLAKTNLTPNHITLLGLALILANCAAYLWHQSNLWFGLGLTLSFTFDALDGALARVQGTASKFGGYLDAVIDRYQEFAVYLTIAWITGWWVVSFLALGGSLLVSYTKARTAMEIPIANHNWPDLMERFERLALLCTALVLDQLIALPAFLGGRVLYLALVVIAVLSQVTAIQRFFRARALILGCAQEKDRPSQ